MYACAGGWFFQQVPFVFGAIIFFGLGFLLLVIRSLRIAFKNISPSSAFGKRGILVFLALGMAFVGIVIWMEHNPPGPPDSCPAHYHLEWERRRGR
ncbi:MAG: hypothetical protein FWF59_07610 [Turicibacter sp.]|nr:hypothetical protein [Turicibacter sp.]